MFSGSNYNNNEKSVNTKIYTMYSDLSCLQLSYWNDKISCKFSLCTGRNSDGIRQYDFDRKQSTALSPEKALSLTEKIEEKILPKMKEIKSGGTLEESINFGIPLGTKNSALFVEYKNDENGVPSLYLILYTNIGPDNKAPDDGKYAYKFNAITMIEDYNPSEGTSENSSTVEGEFLFFYDVLKRVGEIDGVAAHSVNVDAAFKPKYNYRNNNSNGGFNNGFNSNNNFNSNFNSGFNNTNGNYNAGNSYNAPVSTIDDNDFPFN